MKRNIIISFVVHLVIICPYFFIYVLANSIFGNDFNTYLLAILMAFVLMLYCITGRVLLKPTQSKKNNRISVFTLSAVLLIISLVFGCAYRKIIDVDTAYMLSSIDAIINPLQYTSTTFSGLLQEKVTQNEMLNVLDWVFRIVASLIPSFGLWLGFKFNKKTAEVNIIQEMED